ncbi:DNA/RNA-binding protein KIN17 isoform X1 [Hemibagrus wyckioides]|uniref:DNA/RNA-binding protein KIN17 isoform X1 n=1 Tax=Hemibagrus wyckioides TaxID=337641 RepID=UPI00266BAA9D|nr:DNA/RNA-binding protein KIN17 isoform X1 [Hemibagrus wyckioides]
MGKADFLSPKAISNRIKAKGLQKLRWYCQMCQKQCRDENGFKCHCMSESHQRQLLLASENPSQFMDYFSDEFKNDFLELLRRRFGTKRVHNNIIYNEYISHREHVHMNSTQWETLTDFTKWLGREGLCKVDETPKGWYIQYIDRDPETIRRQEELEKKKKQDLDDEERSAKFIEEQVRRGREGKEAEEEPVFTELKREKEEEKVAFNLAGASSSVGPAKASTSLASNALKIAASAKRKDTSHTADSKEKRKKSALDEIMEMEEKKKKSVRSDNWIRPDIVVKVITKRLGEKYYKKKAVIRDIQDKYTAIVKLIDSGDKLKLDQSHLETVIPAPGKRVVIVNGQYRGMEAVLEGIDEKNFSAQLTIDSVMYKLSESVNDPLCFTCVHTSIESNEVNQPRQHASVRFVSFLFEILLRG